MPVAELETDGAYRSANRDGATDRARRAVEGCEERVASGVHLTAAEPLELASYELALILEQLAPALIAKLARTLGRLDDVGEEERREHPVGFRCGASSRQELLDLAEDRVGVPGPGPVVAAGELDEPCARDMLSDVAPMLDADERIVRAMDDEGWRGDRRQRSANVELGVHAHQRRRHAGARRQAEQAGEPGSVAIVALGDEQVGAVARAPAVLGGCEVQLDRGRAPSPRVFLVLRELGEARVENEAGDSVRAGSGEIEAERSSLEDAEQNCSF